MLERHRPCVIHAVATELQADWQYGTALPADAAIKVVVPTSDRCEYLGILLQYRANGNASISCVLQDMTGAVVDAGFSWTTAAGTMEGTSAPGLLTPGFGIQWSLAMLSSGDVPRGVAVLTPRPLIVGAGSRGKTLQVILTPVAAEILSVAIYELSADEVTA